MVSRVPAFKGLYEVKWRYGTWMMMFKGSTRKDEMFENVKYYLFHGTQEEMNKIQSKLIALNKRQGRMLMSVTRIGGI